MKPAFPPAFEQDYQTHLKRLKLAGMRPKTIEAYPPVSEYLPPR